jgi:hypothetical protein
MRSSFHPIENARKTIKEILRMNQRNWMVVLTIGTMVVASLAVTVYAQMPKPKTETLSGVLADFTCASKGKVMMNTWYNATHDDHKTPDGPKPSCATLCLKQLGQPAALFDPDKDQMVAVFACSPQHTLGDYAAQEVEVQGFFAGAAGDHPRAFVPVKIRAAGGSGWTDVTCAAMH